MDHEHRHRGRKIVEDIETVVDEVNKGVRIMVCRGSEAAIDDTGLKWDHGIPSPVRRQSRQSHPKPRRAGDVRLNARAVASLWCFRLDLYSKGYHAIVTCKYQSRNEVLPWTTSIDIEDER